MDALAGVRWWPEDNPRGIDGVAIFRTRQQAREAAKLKGSKPFLDPVRVIVTVQVEIGRQAIDRVGEMDSKGKSISAVLHTRPRNTT